MSYYDFDTHIPNKVGADLNTAHGMLLEKYHHKFPEVKYMSIKLPLQAASGQITTDTSKTVVDDLWGEEVPTSLAAGFVQPHSDVTINAPQDRIFEVPVVVNVHVEYESHTKNLKKFGSDTEHKPFFVFLNWQLKVMGLRRIQYGDQFVWKDTMYEIQTFKLRGRWADTDYFLYSAVEATMKQLGV